MRSVMCSAEPTNPTVPISAPAWVMLLSSELRRVNQVNDFIFDGLQLQYLLAPTRNAVETYRTRAGNCLSFVNLFDLDGAANAPQSHTGLDVKDSLEALRPLTTHPASAVAQRIRTRATMESRRRTRLHPCRRVRLGQSAVR